MCRIAEAFRDGATLPSNALAVTVDDGFRDFLLSGQPVFSRYEIPITVFVITDFLDQKSWPWFSQLECMMDRTCARSIEFLGCELIIKGDRLRLAVRITEALKSLPNAERKAQLESLRRQLDVELPERPPAGYEPLSWDDVRRLAAEGVEFGSHTRSHPVLSRISELAELQEEIAGSKLRLDEQLGFPSVHFSYPFGRRTDFNDRIVAMVRGSGFLTAVTAERGFNNAHSDPLRLFRLGVDPSLSERHFAELLAGVRRY